jgi:hypothetical protein
MFYPSDKRIVQMLLNVKEGITREYDYVLVVSGDTGTGKSHFGLQLAETWQQIIGKKINNKLIDQVNVDREQWLKRFQNLESLDINIFDEGAYGLGSKQYMERFAKTLEMLFQVIRFKQFFTVIIVPNFFRLNKFFREDRLRGLVWISKRGSYKWITRKNVVKLCNLNERRFIKRMDIVTPFHTNKFPEYKGKLLEAYNKQKEEGVNKILNEVIELNTDKRGESENIKKGLIEYAVKEYRENNTPLRKIAESIEKKFNYPTNHITVRNWIKSAVIEVKT